MSKTCDKCINRGVCCRAFILKDTEPWAFSAIETKKKVVSRLKDAKLPFYPIKKGKRNWVFSCKWLNDDGNCNSYENRPKLCRKLRPGTGTLCIMSKRHNGDVTGD